MSDCIINPYSSGVCVLGTKSCVMKHTGILERDKRIAELEHTHAVDAELIRGMTFDSERDRKRIAELEAAAAQQVADFKREIDMVRELKVENERLRHRCDHCGANIIDNCPRCGAPQCCPQCCRIAELEAERDQLGEWMERGNAQVGELVEENERLRNKK